MRAKPLLSVFLVTAAFGVVTLSADAQATPPTCFGEPATIVGTEGNDTIDGTEGPDVIVGLGGHDRISGLGGDDIICGNDGFDDLFGGDGNDKVRGGNGQSEQDQIYGGDGDDELRGGAGGTTSSERLVTTSSSRGVPSSRTRPLPTFTAAAGTTASSVPTPMISCRPGQAAMSWKAGAATMSSSSTLVRLPPAASASTWP
jgi:hypothetical protein